MAEKELQSRLLKTLNGIVGCKAVKVPQDGYGEKGTPDILGCYLGNMFAIECKSASGKLTDIQKVRLSEWKSAGCHAIEVREGDEFDPRVMLQDLIRRW
jgi:Holliday junction resolvase